MQNGILHANDISVNAFSMLNICFRSHTAEDILRVLVLVSLFALGGVVGINIRIGHGAEGGTAGLTVL